MFLSEIIVSKVRIKLLQIFLSQVDELFYVRQLVRMTGEEINAVRRELLRMENSEIVKKEARGNRIYYWVNKENILYNDLLSLVNKSNGLGGEIVKNRAKLGGLRMALLSGRYARNLPTKEGGVDLLIVGNINMPVLAKIIQDEEKKRGLEINYTVMTREELLFRRKRRDPFLAGILAGSRIVLIGDEEDLAGI